MRLVLTSDTHNRHLKMIKPVEAEVLIHAADLSGQCR